MKFVKKKSLAKAIALHNPSKKYYDSTRVLLKWGAERQNDSNNIPSPRAENVYKWLEREHRELIEVGFGILSYWIFWGMIYGITASFLKRAFNVSGITTLVYYLIWMMEPVAGLVFGSLFTFEMSKSRNRSRKLWTMILSAAFLVGSSMMFFTYIIPRLLLLLLGGGESGGVHGLLFFILHSQ
jgi:hypothetical protein